MKKFKPRGPTLRLSLDKTRYETTVSQKKVVVVTTGPKRAKCYAEKVLGLTLVRLHFLKPSELFNGT